MTIREITEQTGISADTLRYYERIGLIPPVPRSGSGVRVYNESFLQLLRLIQELKAGGMSLEAIMDYIKLAQMGEETSKARKELLLAARALLLQKIELLQSKVKQADEQLAQYEKRLRPQTDNIVLSWIMISNVAV